MVKCIKISRQ